jgi:hypothetical protein
VRTLTRDETFTGKRTILCLTVVLRSTGVDEGVDGKVRGNVPGLVWFTTTGCQVTEDEVIELMK